jgi:glycosyltransferase involved in cell wall biosynthesis
VRILHVSDVYFPRVNGVSTSIRTFRRELDALGHTSTLVCPAYPGAAAEPDMVRIPSRYIPLDPEDRAMRWSDLRTLEARLAHEPFDLVHVQTPFFAHYAGLRFARARGIPAVATYHTLFEEYLYHYVPLAPRSWTRALARRFSRGQCNALDAVVVPSGPMRDALAAYGVTAHMEVIPTGIPLDDFTRGDGPAFRARNGISAARPMLLYVGRVAHEKNIGFLLQVLAEARKRVPDVLLVICGEGPAESSLRHQMTRLALDGNVLFVGYLDRATTLLDCYRAADLFVFASRTETQGLVLLEAMACGTPVVALAEMGTRDVLREGAGARIAPRDATGFAAIVVRLLHDAAERTTLAAAAPAYAAQWGARATAERMAAFYGGVVEAARARGAAGYALERA